jgi:hypothetical protein
MNKGVKGGQGLKPALTIAFKVKNKGADFSPFKIYS